MPAPRKLPRELSTWVEERVKLLEGLTAELRAVADHDRENQAVWVLNLLEDLSNIETTARRGVHLLTAYALREQVASPTVVSKRTDVTVTAAQNRAGSKLAQEVWNEVWPARRSSQS